MIIIPEIETVVILVPKTGSTALKHAVKAKYPAAFMPYRHMEADGVPLGYDKWQKIGLVRKPLDRLWSLYRYCQRLEKDSPNWRPGRAAAMQASAVGSFEAWLFGNEEIFARGDDPVTGLVIPYYLTKHPMPENNKSQLLYLRPDLGTKVYRYDTGMALFTERLGIALTERKNAAPCSEPRPKVKIPNGHSLSHLAWDAEVAGGW